MLFQHLDSFKISNRLQVSCNLFIFFKWDFMCEGKKYHSNIKKMLMDIGKFNCMSEIFILCEEKNIKTLPPFCTKHSQFLCVKLMDQIKVGLNLFTLFYQSFLNEGFTKLTNQIGLTPSCYFWPPSLTSNVSGPRQNVKNLVGRFSNINIKIIPTNFSFQTEGWDRGDRQTFFNQLKPYWKIFKLPLALLGRDKQKIDQWTPTIKK